MNKYELKKGLKDISVNDLYELLGDVITEIIERSVNEILYELEKYNLDNSAGEYSDEK